jgi:hypothetical protein
LPHYIIKALGIRLFVEFRGILWTRSCILMLSGEAWF